MANNQTITMIIGGQNYPITVENKVITALVGSAGKEIELQKGTTYIQWRVVGASTWINLVALADLAGTPGSNGTNGTNGSNGLSVELQTTSTHIQWKQTGGSWANLVALADLMPTNAVTSTTATEIVVLTQAAYDLLTPVSTTLYIIIG